MTTLYGKQAAIQTLDAMCRNDRMAHSILLYGEAGMGKKTLARYLAARLFCTDAAHAPCGSCKPCRNIENDQHPDVRWVEHSGKLLGFSVETIRSVCADAHIMPNNGARKLYLFADADNMTVQAQNALLKLVEEPPEFAYFIFTAQSRHAFLETILSRVVSIGIGSCSQDACQAALIACGYTPQQCAAAMECFGGNIGMCIAWLTDSAVQETVTLTKQATDCIINRDEYGLLVTLTGCAADKERLRTVLQLLDCQLRDALVTRYDSAAQLGCYPGGARTMGERISVSQAERLHFALAQANADLTANVAPVLTVTALCAEIMK